MKPRWFFFCCFFCVAVVLCPAALAAAKTARGPSLPAGHRFLFVVETSAASSRLSFAVRQAVVDMIWSGLDGQMQPGDTYGLWTYNEEPRTGIFPMQTWTNTISLDLASQAGRFLRDQPYANRSRLDRLFEKLQTVIRVVKDVDIILVSGSDGPISNTPFDQQINAAWRGKNSDLRDGKKPLITILAARNGKITNWSVTVAGEPIRLAERPALADTAPSSVTNAPPKTAVITSSPPVKLIIEKPRAVALPSEILSSSTGAAPGTVVSQASVATPAPTVSALDPKIESTPPPPAPEVAPPSGQRPPETPTPASVATVANKLSTTASQLEPLPLAAPPPLSSDPPVESVVPERFGAASDAASTSIKPPGQAVVAAREPAPAIRAVSPQREVATELVAVPPWSLFSPVTMALIGSALLLSTLVLILLFVRRSAPIPQPSLITQSIERARSADSLSAR